MHSIRHLFSILYYPFTFLLVTSFAVSADEPATIFEVWSDGRIEVIEADKLDAYLLNEQFIVTEQISGETIT